MNRCAWTIDDARVFIHENFPSRTERNVLNLVFEMVFFVLGWEVMLPTRHRGESPPRRGAVAMTTGNNTPLLHRK